MHARLRSRTLGAGTLCLCLACAVSLGQDADAALGRELLADASARASFQSGGVAGHDGKFFLASPDGDFRLTVGALLQYRYNVNLRDTDEPDEDLTNGFDFRRAKLFMGGRVRPGIEYYVQGAFFCGEGDFRLEFAEMSHRFESGLGVTWGQFKLPFLHEELVSEKYLLAADRSVTHAALTAGTSQGAMLWYEGEAFRLSGALSDGIASCNMAYYDPREADLACTARAELRLGEAPWKAYSAFTSFPGDPAGVMIGGAVHWQTSGDTGNTLTFAGTQVPDVDVLAGTIDASYLGGGWGLYGAFIARDTDASDAGDATDLGAIAQGSAFVGERVELFARWDAVLPDDDRESGDEFNTVTVGANHYFVPRSFAARLTADLQWFLDSQVDAASLVVAPSGVGVLPGEEEGQLYLRIQMQLLF